MLTWHHHVYYVFIISNCQSLSLLQWKYKNYVNILLIWNNSKILFTFTRIPRCRYLQTSSAEKRNTIFVNIKLCSHIHSTVFSMNFGPINILCKRHKRPFETNCTWQRCTKIFLTQAKQARWSVSQCRCCSSPCVCSFALNLFNTKPFFLLIWNGCDNLLMAQDS